MPNEPKARALELDELSIMLQRAKGMFYDDGMVVICDVLEGLIAELGLVRDEVQRMARDGYGD